MYTITDLNPFGKYNNIYGHQERKLKLVFRHFSVYIQGTSPLVVEKNFTFLPLAYNYWYFGNDSFCTYQAILNHISGCKMTAHASILKIYQRTKAGISIISGKIFYILFLLVK